ncbi:TetR/AcrR family transcriptional regulator [Pseudanabaena sp. FACHB-2040]|uniref:TetR/AcrR family transcriptional regulator n=1 Tax=Pseudanabaena sp. FACHB-2040 TaxID=2692859 RepID=UPI00168906A4|nr:TetR/AcrR family transcriptional regulator [Pseudanabaena sp. FACHB-2040]MBD2258262.1 TetR/AcrR family transcriptional regulator [Pseudanabaena sp. FACHB-2040]
MRQAKSGRPERQLSPEKTEAILEGGMQEFLTHGYAATTMDRVAIAAKVSKATVYSHFQDKEGLFIVLIQRLVEQKFQSIFGAEDDRILQMPPQDVLKSFANRALDIGATEPQFLNFMRLILGESGRFPQLARAFVHNIEQTAFSRLCHYLTNCPQLKLADPEATARIFVGAIVHFMIVQEMLHGKDILPMERDRLVNSLVGLIVG